MKKINPSLALIVLASLLGSIAATMLAGCNHDVDPHAKIDAPDYYNGPMKGHGGNAAGQNKAGG